jgi:serine protease inhibitor
MGSQWIFDFKYEFHELAGATVKTAKLRLPAIVLFCAASLASTPLMAQSTASSGLNSIEVERFQRANYFFSFDLLNQIAADEPGTNIFISPGSVATAMQMVCEGAAGTTKSEIQNTLKTSAMPPEDLNLAWEELYNSFNSPLAQLLPTASQLKMADGMWYQNNIHLNPYFAAVIHNTFQAEATPVNFSDPATANLINEWASNQTEGRIKDLVSPPFPNNTALVLANAIYFKAKWLAEFDKALTKPRDFHLPDGTAEQVPMMSKHTRFYYSETPDYQAVQLPYKNRRRQMTIFLPKKPDALQHLLAEFGNRAWVTQHPSIFSYSEREGTLVFPKFKFDYDILLNVTLKRLGIRQAFDPLAADFSPMGTGPAPVFISKVKQKSFVSVDEEGTEAAAATVVEATYGSEDTNPPKPFEMIVNRPFLFVITTTGVFEESYGAPIILFMGIVDDPMDISDHSANQ